MENKKLIISLFVTVFIVLVAFGIRLFYLAESDPVRASKELTIFSLILVVLFPVVMFIFGGSADFGFTVFILFVVSIQLFTLGPLVEIEEREAVFQPPPKNDEIYDLKEVNRHE